MLSRRTRMTPSALPLAMLLGLAAAPALIALGCNRVPLLAPSGSTITLTAAATALPANSSTTLIAQVLESAGTPPQDGTLVTFTTSLGTIEPTQAETLGGRVTARFMSGTQSGTATITASSGGASVAAADAVKIAVGAAAVASISVVANPGTLPSAGGNSTITATVIDAAGNTLSSVPVSFSTDVGSVSPTVVSADANGRAQTTLTTTRTAIVTASAGVATTTLTKNTVTVTVNATQTITIGTITPASPTVGQAVVVPLTYSTTAGASPITRVSVNWGDGSVDTFGGQPSSVSHTYSAAGTYGMQVTGTDSAGESPTTSASITVTAAPRPSVGLSVTNDTPKVNVSVTFTVNASVPGGGTTVIIRSVRLDFGDGRFADLGPTGTTAAHTYTTTGSYTAVATATDTNGRTATASLSITVIP